MVHTILQIFTKPKYLLLAIGSGVLVFNIAILLPNYTIIGSSMRSERYTQAQRFDLYRGLIGGFSTNLNRFNQITLVVIAILFGMNVTLLTYYLHYRYEMQKQLEVGITGLLFGMLGIGCSSCGSVILTSVLGIGFTTYLMNTLPFHGYELSILSIILLLGSNGMLLRKISQPIHCERLRIVT